MKQQTLITSISKVLIASKLLQGGLNNLKQKYVFNYLIPKDDHTPKIELAIFMVKNGMNYGEYRSLRFDRPYEIDEFILDLFKAKVHYEIQTGILKRGNKDLKLRDILTEISKVYSQKFNEVFVPR